MLDLIRNLSLQASPGMPPETWWLAILILFALVAAAAIDAWEGIVPDVIIFFGLIAITAAQGFFVDWPVAAGHLAWALGAAVVIWVINEIWHRAFRHDAIGMGDAKWTMLAVMGFGLYPSLIAWGVGACLALLWMGVLRVAKRPIERVHFAPFLFFGLIAGIFWLRFKI